MGARGATKHAEGGAIADKMMRGRGDEGLGSAWDVLAERAMERGMCVCLGEGGGRREGMIEAGMTE